MGLFVAAYFASNIVLSALIPRVRSQRMLDAGVLLFDAVAICLALALTRNASTDFFILYFVVLFLGAPTERIGLVVAAAVITGLVHLTTVAHYMGFAQLMSDGYLMRIPFLFVVAMFFSHLAQEDRRTRELMRSEFLSTVSHDLKSPLGVIQSLADLLLEGDAGALNDDQTMLIRRIHVSVRHVLTLSTNLLSAARIEAGELTLQRTMESLRLIIEKALAFARSASDLKHITLRLSPDADLPAVSIDRVQIERVAFNLIDNAIKYTPDGGTVEVVLHQLTGKVALIVRDNGPGIPADQLPSLFLKYRSRPRDSTVEGSGLGLFIVRAIVEAHGGQITVESAVNRGTTVTVYLPVNGLAVEADLPAVLEPSRRWTRVGTSHKSRRRRSAGCRVPGARCRAPEILRFRTPAPDTHSVRLRALVRGPIRRALDVGFERGLAVEQAHERCPSKRRGDHRIGRRELLTQEKRLTRQRLAEDARHLAELLAPFVGRRRRPLLLRKEDGVHEHLQHRWLECGDGIHHPLIVQAARRSADRRSEPLSRILIGQVHADRGRLEHREITVGKCRDRPVRMNFEVLWRFVRSASEVDFHDLVGFADLLEEPADADRT